MRIAILALGLALTLSNTARAGLQDGLTAFDRQDYEAAATELLPWAEQGHPGAQFCIGTLYYLGRGLPKDRSLAAQWFERAGEQGHAGAQYFLGSLYFLGQGVEKDGTNAATWFHLAAEQGHVESQHRLGHLYEMGRGVDQSYESAAHWYRRAAEQNFPDAQNTLGSLYEAGEGVVRDYAVAVEWYRRAAHQGHAEAQINLGSMYAVGRGTGRDDVQAYTWIAVGQSALPDGPTRDEAIHALGLVADSLTGPELAAAETLIGHWYESGHGVERDTDSAAEWYRRAVERGHAEAQTMLGFLSEIGDGVDQDLEAAAGLYRLAAAQGYPEAQHYLGQLFAAGRGVEQDDIQAYRWLTLAEQSLPATGPREEAARSREAVAARMTDADIAAALRLVENGQPDSE